MRSVRRRAATSKRCSVYGYTCGGPCGVHFPLPNAGCRLSLVIRYRQHEDVAYDKPLLESKEKAPSKLQAIPEQGLEGAFSPSENRLDRYEIPVSQMYSF
jgi:hypothetical protein